MTIVTRKQLQWYNFEAYASGISSYIPSQNGTAMARRIYGRDGQIQFVPYSLDHWRQYIANGEGATTIMNGVRFRMLKNSYYNCAQERRTLSGNTSSIRSYGRILANSEGPDTGAIASVPLAGALAAEKFLEDYYEKSRSVRGGSIVAEIGSTIRGLASPAKALRKEVSNLHASMSKRLYRSNGVAIRDGSKVLAGIWLEWVFGIKPLVSDVNDAAVAFNKLSEGNFHSTIPVRGVGFADRVVSKKIGISMGTPSTPGGLGSQAPGIFDRWVTDESLVIIRGGYKMNRPGGEIPPVQQFGLGFEDILPSVWEGVPWSFFFDYFFNLQSVINAWSFIDSNLKWCNRTVRNSRVTTYSDLRPFPDDEFGSSYIHNHASGGHAKASYTSVLRYPVSWEDIAPTLRIKIPNTSSKWCNIAALAAMFNPPHAKRRWKKLRKR